jgi:hypothetical protein
MRKFYLFLYGFIFTILTLAVFLVGCGGSNDPLGLCYEKLYCSNTLSCCPAGKPYKCDHSDADGNNVCKATSTECDGYGGVDELCT